MTSFIGDGQATKETLGSIFRGAMGDGPPAVLFSGSHGAEFSMTDLPRQRREQGALVTQEWVPGKPVEEGQRFSADDLASLDPATPAVHGLLVFLFACFSGGCPTNDSYVFNTDGSKKALTPEPLIAQLPQALLTRGALAVVAHVDRAFSYGFADVLGTPQVQVDPHAARAAHEGETRRPGRRSAQRFVEEPGGPVGEDAGRFIRARLRQPRPSRA